MDLILIHGALGCKSLFDESVPTINATCHSIDLYGHGTESLNPKSFTIEGFGKQVIEYMDSHNILKANIFGHSMGGYVALWIAANYPNKVHETVTLGTKLGWTKEVATREIKFLDPDKIIEKIPKFAQVLEVRHGKKWSKLLKATAQLMVDLGDYKGLTKSNYQAIKTPTTLCLGEFDKMVTEQETREVAAYISNSDVQIVEGFQHPLESIKTEQLGAFINQMFQYD